MTTEPAHIALFMPSLAGGGAERMMLNLAGEFRSRGARVTLVLATATGEYGHLVPPDVEVVDLARPNVITAVPGLISYLRRARPASMLVTLDHAAVVAIVANRIAGSRTKIFVRQACAITAAERPSVKERVLPLVQRMTYPFAERIIAVSRGVADDVHAQLGLKRDRITVLANPVLTPDLPDLASQPANHPWLDQPSTPVILAAGRLHRQKGFDTLLDAFALVRKTSEARLVLLGEGLQRDALKEQADRLGISEFVSMPGFARNPFAFMRRANLFVLSSRWEGLPGVLLQAMACGCPVVSTDCPSGPREILNDGEYGPLVPVDDSKAMARAIIEQLASPRSPELLRAAIKPYSAHESGARYLDVLTGAA